MDKLAVREILARVPLFAGRGDIELGRLAGVQSLNNDIRIVTLTRSAERFVLRLANPLAVSHLGVRRAEEQACATGAASAGAGPAVLYFDAELGHMVTPWIEAGPTWTAQDFGEPQKLKQLVDLLHRLHAVEVPGDAGAVFRRIERLLAAISALGLETPPALGEYRRRLAGIEAARAGGRQVLNHNDLWANNLLDDGRRLWLIDWEFSGRGDGSFDLATICMAGNFDAAQEQRLLDLYGLDGAERTRTLQDSKWLVRFFEAAWSLVMDHLSADRHDATGARFDFRGHSKRMFDGLAD